MRTANDLVAKSEDLKHVYKLRELAFRELYRAYVRPVYWIAHGLVRNRADAEDVTSEVFMALADRRYIMKAEAKCSTWIYTGTSILLAKASKSNQEPFIGNQAGGRVFLFLNTDNFWRDYEDMKFAGINFVRNPREEDYGIVAVFQDLYGNLWDLIQYT